jgi:hypothetical protein
MKITKSENIKDITQADIFRGFLAQKSRDSSVGIRLDDRGSRVWFPVGGGNFSLHRVQEGSGAHPASHTMDTKGYFPGGKEAGAWSWPFT